MWMWNRASIASWRSRIFVLTFLLLGWSLTLTNGFSFSDITPAKAANGLTLTKTSDGDPLLGGNIKYTISVLNTGNTPQLYNLNVQDVLPPGTTFVSSSIGAPSSITSAGGGCAAQQTLLWNNIKDLALNETFSVTIIAKLDPCILAGANLTNNGEVSGAPDPRQIAPSIFAGGASVTNQAKPFKLTKTTVQSTGVSQDLGSCNPPGEGRKFYFKLQIENNFVGASQNAVLDEQLPDGVTYCGVMLPDNGANTTLPVVVGPDPVTGITRLTWNPGTLAVGQVINYQPQVVLAYKFFGTNNGAPTALVPDNFTFTNQAALTGDYLSQSYNYPSQSTVKGKYTTLAKAQDKDIVSYGDQVTYTLTPSTSTNYNASNMFLVDTIPDGQDYVAGSASITPLVIPNAVHTACAANPNLAGSAANNHGGVTSSPAPGVYLCNDGTTQITWGPLNDSPTTPMTAGTQFNVTLKGVVRTTYRSNGAPVLAGDSFTNQVGIRFDADSIGSVTPPNTGAGGFTNRARWDNADVTQTTEQPELLKSILDVKKGNDTTPPTGEGAVTDSNGLIGGNKGVPNFNHNAKVAIGDIVTFQLETNASPSADAGSLILRDFLPLNYAYIVGSTTYCNFDPAAYAQTVNNSATNIVVTNPACSNLATIRPEPNAGATPAQPGNILEWQLTGAAGSNTFPRNANFKVQFRARVLDIPAGTTPPANSVDAVNDNLAKLTSLNTDGAAFSLRDVVKLTNIAPQLTLDKTTTASGVSGNDVYDYSVKITNVGNATAYQPANLVDALPPQIKYIGPSVISATPAACTSGAFVSYVPLGTGFGGNLTYSLANIPPGCAITFVYTVQTNPNPEIVDLLINTATVNSYTSQPPGPTGNQTQVYGPISDTTSVPVKLGDLSKTLTINQAQVNGVGGPVTIGDAINYEIQFSIPANTNVSGNNEVRDCLPPGFRYVPGTYSFTTSSALPGPGALPVNDAAAGFVVGGGTAPCTNNREMIRIIYGSQNNTGGAVVVTVQIRAVITGVDLLGNVLYTAFAAANPTVPNFIYRVRDGAQLGNTVDSNTVPVAIPHLNLTKNLIRPASPTKGGVDVVFRVKVVNNGSSPAYSVAPLLDTLDLGLNYVGTFTSSDDNCTETSLVAYPGVTQAGQVLTIPVNPDTISNVGPNNFFRVCVKANLATTASPETVYTNAVAFNGTGNQDFFTAPPSYPSRRPIDNTQTPSASIATPPVILTKSETSGNPSPNNQATPGEEVVYNLQFTIPGGTTLYGGFIRDNYDFSAAGAAYGTPTDVTPGTPTLVCTGGTTPASGGYTFAVIAGKATFTFAGNLVADAGVDSTCILRLKTRLLNIAGNTRGNIISNDFTIGFRKRNTTPVGQNSGRVDVTVIEPDLSLGKTLVQPYDTVTGQANFNLTIRNNSVTNSADAYDLTVIDPLPAGLRFVSNTLPVPPPVTGILNPAVSVVANTITLTVGKIPPGQSYTIEVTVEGDGTLSPGSTVLNVATLSGYDLPNSINGNNNQSNPNSRRVYTDTAQLSFNLPPLVFSKTPALQNITIGQPVTYTLAFTVPAQTSLYNTVISDVLPLGLVTRTPGLSYVGVTPVACPAPGTIPAPADGSLSFGTIANTTNGNCVYSVQVRAQSDSTVPDVNTGTSTPLTNIAEIKYTQTSNPGSTVITVNDTANVIITAPVIQLAKINVPTGPVTVGEIITYTLVVTNSGAAPATGTVLTDTLPTNVTVVAGSITGGGVQSAVPVPNIRWTIGILNPGQTLTFSYRVTVVDISSGVVINSAEVTTNERPRLTDSVVNSLANLQASKGAVPPSGTTVVPGQTIQYSITIANPSPAVTLSRNIVVTDVVPANTTLVAGSPGSNCGAGTTLAGNVINWTVATLAVDATCNLTFNVTVNSPLPNGTVINNVASYSSSELTVPSNTNVVTHNVQSAPAIALSKTESTPGPVGVGGIISYTLVLVNTGTENATNLTISDTLPVGTNFTAASNGGVFTPATRQVVWTVGSLNAPNGVLTFTLEVEVQGGANGQVPPARNITNNATYSYDTPTGNTGSGSSNTVTATTASHLLTKINDPLEPVLVAPGDLITYTLTFTNTGTGTLNPVQITDPLPAQTTFVSADNGGTFTAPNISWNLGAVTAGGVRKVSFVVRALPSPAGTNRVIIPNRASVSSGGVTTGVLPDVDSNIVQNQILSAPVLKITKMNVPTTPVKGGDIITYNLDVENSGTGNATNVIISDTVPVGTSYVPNSATGGDTITISGNLITWKRNLLAKATTERFSFQVRVNDVLPTNGNTPVKIANTAYVASNETPTGDPPTPSNEVSNDTVGVKLLKVGVRPGYGKQVSEGGTISYNLIVTNTGSLILRGMELTDDIPAATTYLSSNNGGVFSPQPAGGAQRGRVTWIIASLAPGASATYNLQIRVDKPAVPARLTIVNTALLRVAELNDTIISNSVLNPTTNIVITPTPVPTQTPIVTVTPTPPGTPTPTFTPGTTPGLTPTPGTTVIPTPTPVIGIVDPFITKEVDRKVAALGQTVIFTIKITNPGTVPFSNLVVRDTLPAPFTVQNATTTQGTISTEGQDVTANIGTVAPGATITITVITTVTKDLKGSFINVASFTGQKDGQPIEGKASATVDIPDLPITGLPPTPAEPAVNWLGLVLGLVLIGFALYLARRKLFNTRGHN